MLYYSLQVVFSILIYNLRAHLRCRHGCAHQAGCRHEPALPLHPGERAEHSACPAAIHDQELLLSPTPLTPHSSLSRSLSAGQRSPRRADGAHWPARQRAAFCAPRMEWRQLQAERILVRGGGGGERVAERTGAV